MNMNESLKENILRQYQTYTTDKPVFDMVLSEDHKYLIMMDEVFVNGGGGVSIGTIWENMHVFSDIMKSNLRKNNLLNEETEKQLDSITWDKDIIKECINESFTNKIGDWVNDNWKTSWNNLKDGKNAIASAFKGEVLPFLRWVRKMSLTNIGIVVDIITSILTVKGSAIIWFVIVGLDIYEIATGNFDPEEPERKEMAYLFLIFDLMSAMFSAVAGKMFKTSMKQIAKSGVTNPRLYKYLSKIANNLPTVSGKIKNALEILSNKLNKGGFLKKLITMVDGVLNKLVEFIKRLLKKGVVANASKEGIVAGSKVIAMNKGIETGVGLYTNKKSKHSKEDNDVMDDYLNKKYGTI